MEERRAERREAAALQDQLRLLQAQLQLEESVLRAQIRLGSQMRRLRAHLQLPVPSRAPLRPRLVEALRAILQLKEREQLLWLQIHRQRQRKRQLWTQIHHRRRLAGGYQL